MSPLVGRVAAIAVAPAVYRAMRIDPASARKLSAPPSFLRHPKMWRMGSKDTSQQTRKILISGGEGDSFRIAPNPIRNLQITRSQDC